MTVPTQTALRETCRCGQPARDDDRARCLRGHVMRGDELALVHAARAGRELETATAHAAADIDEALSPGPGLEPRYIVARAGAARGLARTHNLTEYLDRNGWLDGKGRPRPATKLLETAESTLLAYLRELGMTPASAAKLGLNVARGKDRDPCPPSSFTIEPAPAGSG